MKRLVTILFFILSFSILAPSQELSELQHLLFKGLPIDGTVESFTAGMKRSGFSFVESRNDVAFFRGKFASFDNSVVSVVSSQGAVWKVVVDLPGCDTWSSVKKVYELFKRSYVTKYEVTPEVTEKFPNYVPEGSGREVAAFRDETAVWESLYCVPNGTIKLSVQPVLSGPGRFFVRMEYVDEFNYFMQNNALLSDI